MLGASGRAVRSRHTYIILSNVLSNLLNKAAEAGRFQYHPQCQGVKLTHLSFADDIVVLTNGTVGSLQGVVEVMQNFATMSGLHINATKSTIFASGLDVAPLLAAAASLGISAGSLPIRYLGMPLTSKSLTPLDYEPLIDKVSSKC